MTSDHSPVFATFQIGGVKQYVSDKGESCTACVVSWLMYMYVPSSSKTLKCFVACEVGIPLENTPVVM